MGQDVTGSCARDVFIHSWGLVVAGGGGVGLPKEGKSAIVMRKSGSREVAIRITDST
jgi:hypothetical protein